MTDYSRAYPRPTIAFGCHLKQFLLVEKGGFVEEEDASTEDEEEDGEEDTENQDSYEEQQAKPWHCGYIVYERVK